MKALVHELFSSYNGLNAESEQSLLQYIGGLAVSRTCGVASNRKRTSSGRFSKLSFVRDRRPARCCLVLSTSSFPVGKTCEYNAIRSYEAMSRLTALDIFGSPQCFHVLLIVERGQLVVVGLGLDAEQCSGTKLLLRFHERSVDVLRKKRD